MSELAADTKAPAAADADTDSSVEAVDDESITLLVNGKPAERMYPMWSRIHKMDATSQKRKDFLAIKAMSDGDKKNTAIAALFRKYVSGPSSMSLGSEALVRGSEGETKNVLAHEKDMHGMSGACCGKDCGGLCCASLGC